MLILLMCINVSIGEHYRGDVDVEGGGDEHRRCEAEQEEQREVVHDELVRLDRAPRQDRLRLLARTLPPRLWADKI